MDKQYPVLKGEDAVVYQTAKSLGLAVDVKPICGEDETIYEGKFMYIVCNLLFFIIERFILCNFQPYEGGFLFDDEEDSLTLITYLFGDVVSADKVTWCQEFKDNLWDPLGSAFRYDPYHSRKTTTVFYQVPSILIVVPK